MADTPWTPGPYHTAPWGDGSIAPGTLNVLSEAAQTVIAQDIPEAEAKLFASAPEMAELLLEICSDPEWDAETVGNLITQDWVDAVHAVLAAAGSSE